MSQIENEPRGTKALPVPKPSGHHPHAPATAPDDDAPRAKRRADDDDAPGIGGRGAKSELKLPTAEKGAAAPEKVPGYHDAFGGQGFVKDGGDKKLLHLMEQAMDALPSLAHGSFGDHVKAGHVSQDDVRALQQALEAKGYSVGSTGVDGLYGPRTHAGLTKLLEGAKPDFEPGSAPPNPAGYPVSPDLPTGDGKTYNIGGPQPAVKRQGKYIGQGIAGRFDALVAAAKKDGVDLRIESGMRTRAEQEVLWDRYGHNPARVAPPGTSNHEKGNAIDFSDTPGAFAWLKAHSTRFGFHNYPPEPWHYSLDGH